ncbi:MAG: tRNA lysidine(34) synthetase TilS [Gemmataceae bacterium]|nr:tRNA lysidine(34) synthetase TilS [Gemmataceae bacterium]
MPAVAAAIRAFMAGHPGPGVVAVSGGADSVALLQGLVEVGAGPLTVAHFDHALRGAESDADAAFVRELAARLGLPFRLGRGELRADAPGLEAAARRQRYDWLAGVAAEAGAGWVATGHTADDQAETVLHRLVRGTGLQGLRGMGSQRPHPLTPSPAGGGGTRQSPDPSPRPPPPQGEGEEDPSRGLSPVPPPPAGEGDRGWGCFDLSPLSVAGRGLGGGVLSIIRPLLAVSRSDILAYLASLGQPYRDDSSNADRRFTRNRIRHELLPLLRSFNPDVAAALNRLAEQAAEAHEVIAGQAAGLLVRAELPRAGAIVVLDPTPLMTAPKLVVREALRLVWEREGWPLGDMTADHWDFAVDAAVRSVGRWDFPGGVAGHFRGRVVAFGPGL